MENHVVKPQPGTHEEAQRMEEREPHAAPPQHAQRGEGGGRHRQRGGEEASAEKRRQQRRQQHEGDAEETVRLPRVGVEEGDQLALGLNDGYIGGTRAVGRAGARPSRWGQR